MKTVTPATIAVFEAMQKLEILKIAKTEYLYQVDKGKTPNVCPLIVWAYRQQTGEAIAPDNESVTDCLYKKFPEMNAMRPKYAVYNENWWIITDVVSRIQLLDALIFKAKEKLTEICAKYDTKPPYPFDDCN